MAAAGAGWMASREREKAVAAATTTEKAASGMVLDIVADLKDQEGLRVEARRKLLSRALQTIDQVLRADPGQTRWLDLKFAALGQFVDALERGGDLDGAIDAARQAVALARRRADEDPTGKGGDLARALYRLGELEAKTDAQSDAERDLRAAQRQFSAREEAGDGATAETGRAAMREGARASWAAPAQAQRAAKALDQAAASAQASLDEARAPGASGDSRGEAESLILAARIALARHRAAEALAFAERAGALERLRAEQDPGDLSLQTGRVAAAMAQGEALSILGRQAEALVCFRAAQPIADRLAERDSRERSAQRDRARLLELTAGLVGRQGDAEAALVAARAAVAAREKILTAATGNIGLDREAARDYALAIEALGDASGQLMRFYAARDEYKKAADIWERLIRQEPDNLDHQRRFADLWGSRAYADRRLGLLDQAVAEIEQASARCARLAALAPTDPAIAKSLASATQLYAAILLDQRDYAAALDKGRLGDAQFASALALAPDDPELVFRRLDVAQGRAIALDLLRRREQAHELAQQTLAGLEVFAQAHPQFPEISAMRARLAQIISDAGVPPR